MAGELALFITYCDDIDVDRILHKYSNVTKIIYIGAFVYTCAYDDIRLKKAFQNVPLNIRKITTDNEYIKYGKIPYGTKAKHIEDDEGEFYIIYENIKEKYDEKRNGYKHAITVGNFIYNCDTCEYFEV